MRNLTSFMVAATLACLSGSVSAAQTCTIGVSSVEAKVVETGSGAVRVRMVQTGCPIGTNVQIGVMVFDASEKLEITRWPAMNQMLLTLPVFDGIPSVQKTFLFNYSGSGTVKFQVSIQRCNGQACNPDERNLSPNHVRTSTIELP